MILSDMPQTQKGSWFLHYREKMDKDLIEGIKATLYEIWHTKERIREMRKKKEKNGGRSARTPHRWNGCV